MKNRKYTKVASLLLITTLVFSGCLSSFARLPKDVDEYQKQRASVVVNNEFNVDTKLNENEKILDKKLKSMVKDYKDKTTDFTFSPAQPFYYFNDGQEDDIRNTDIYKLLTKMPKGSNLHTHTTATMVAAKLYNIALNSDKFYICLTPTEKYLEAQLYVSDDKSTVPEGFVSFKEAVEKGLITKERIMSLWTIDAADESVEHIWNEFNAIFGRVEAGSKGQRYYFKKYYEEAFKEYINDGIDHVELRASLIKFDGDPTGIESIKLIKEAYHEVKKQHPDFTLKLILSYAKVKSKKIETVETFLNSAYDVKQKIKDDFDPNNVQEFIIGFDLVNEEDAGYTLEEYSKYILNFRNSGKKLDAYFHAGESNDPSSNGIVDAYLLGSKRIGHGLNLYKYPDLLEKIKRKGIAVEVCPISNQLLRYVDDLRTHPGYEYLKRGVPVVLCSDDPAIFDNAGLSFDFFEATVAWELGVEELKQLCINSIKYSGCTDAEKQEMMAKWQVKWDKFVQDNI